MNDETEAEAKNWVIARVRAVAEKVGLTPEEVARAIISFYEANADDPDAADKLRQLREVNPTFEPMDN